MMKLNKRGSKKEKAINGCPDVMRRETGTEFVYGEGTQVNKRQTNTR